MNAEAQEQSPAPHGLPLLAAMARTRLELAALELESHVLRSLGALVMGGVSLVLAVIAMTFAGITVIAAFWDTHRVAATSGVALGYLLLAIAVAAHARVRWTTRPAPFAATLRELELDRDAVRDLRRSLS